MQRARLMVSAPHIVRVTIISWYDGIADSLAILGISAVLSPS